MCGKVDKCCYGGVSCSGSSTDEPGGCEYYLPISMMDDYSLSERELKKDYVHYLEEWRLYIRQFDDDVFI